MTLPNGFATAVVGEVTLLVSEGPSYAAAGLFPGGSDAVLWTGQVASDGLVRAVAVDPQAASPEEPTSPEGFQHVHRVAEQAAACLGIGAVDVAVLPGSPDPARTVHRDGWSVAALGTGHAVVLLTDADLPVTDLEAALGDLPTVRPVLLLAGGAAGTTPPAAELATALAEALDHSAHDTPAYHS